MFLEHANPVEDVIFTIMNSGCQALLYNSKELQYYCFLIFVKIRGKSLLSGMKRFRFVVPELGVLKYDPKKSKLLQ